MSSALFIVLEREIPGFDPLVNGKFFAHASDELAETAAKLGVTPLMEFFSQDPGQLTDFLEDEGLETEEIELPTETWFSASQGLKTVDALVNHLQKVPNSAPQAAGTLSDLQEFQSVLRRADAEGVRWHLNVDF